MLEQAEIRDLLRTHGIHPNRIGVIPAKPSNKVYNIDDQLLLRCASAPMDHDIERIRRVEFLSNVPTLKHTGSFRSSGGEVFYAIMDFIEGDDLIGACSGLSQEQHLGLGRDVAHFLRELHSIEGDCYDIGHYIPTIAHYEGSWQQGHARYCAILRKGLSGLRMEPRETLLIDESFAFIDAKFGCLEFQSGPRLLHNDFHPKNIIVTDGSFSGVIDWECSQFGEADFELSHLIHWCLYPPDPSINLRPFLKSVIRQLPYSKKVPDLETRLTIYQIEHDINQILWSNGEIEADRITRIEGWLDGEVGDLLLSL